MPTPKKAAAPKSAPKTKTAPKTTNGKRGSAKNPDELELTAADEKALDNAWAKVAREMGVVAGQPLPWRLTEAEKKSGSAKKTTRKKA